MWGAIEGEAVEDGCGEFGESEERGEQGENCGWFFLPPSRQVRQGFGCVYFTAKTAKAGVDMDLRIIGFEKVSFACAGHVFQIEYGEEVDCFEIGVECGWAGDPCADGEVGGEEFRGLCGFREDGGSGHDVGADRGCPEVWWCEKFFGQLFVKAPAFGGAL